MYDLVIERINNGGLSGKTEGLRIAYGWRHSSFGCLVALAVATLYITGCMAVAILGDVGLQEAIVMALVLVLGGWGYKALPNEPPQRVIDMFIGPEWISCGVYSRYRRRTVQRVLVIESKERRQTGRFGSTIDWRVTLELQTERGRVLVYKTFGLQCVDTLTKIATAIAEETNIPWEKIRYSFPSD
jgi:hypothetical protein